MKLEEFVASTITGIVMGVIEAQKRTKGTKTQIAPWTLVQNSKDGERTTVKGRTGVAADAIEFDLRITYSKEGEGKIGFVEVLTGKVRASSEVENRVRFRVPILLPR